MDRDDLDCLPMAAGRDVNQGQGFPWEIGRTDRAAEFSPPAGGPRPAQDGNGPNLALDPALCPRGQFLRVMGRPISSKCYGFDGPLSIMGRLKYFSIILNHEYYEHF